MLRVLTYNIWFNEFIAEDRLNSLKLIVDETQPHVICLQEVRERIHDQILNIFDEYTIKPESLDQRYDSIILIKNDKDVQFTSYTVVEFEHSLMMRNLHVVNLQYKNVDFIIGNSHFESIFDSDDERIKYKYHQYKQAKDILENIFRTTNEEELVLCCDSNLTSDGICIFNEIYSEWKDAWIYDDDGYTYDTHTNPYLKKLKKEIRFRLDRILKYGSKTKIESTKILNKSSTSVKKEASDHYGVLTHLKLI